MFDVMVSTSLWEGLPCTFLEAMSASKPIVSTSVDGTPDVIEEEVNGYLVPAGDGSVEEIAEKVIRLLKDPGLAKDMGRKGSEKLRKEFDIDNVVTRIEKLYDEVLGARI